MTLSTLDDILNTFSLLDDWEDRYRYVIELGGQLPQLPEKYMHDNYKVNGCASQVWIVFDVKNRGELNIQGYSDAHIVRGLIAIVLAYCNGKTVFEFNLKDCQKLFKSFGLTDHLTVQRSNGLSSMLNHIDCNVRLLRGSLDQLGKASGSYQS